MLELRRFLPDLDVRAPGLAAHVDDASPGLRHQHYAPLVGASLVSASELDAVWDVEHIGIIGRTVDAMGRAPRAGFTVVLGDDPEAYAHEMFSALYRAERAAPSRLMIAAVPDDETWIGVRDRLLRATA